MSVPHHIPLQNRKALAARLEFLDAVCPHWRAGALEAGGPLVPFEVELVNITNRATNITGGSPNSVALDVFVAGAFRELDHRAIHHVAAGEARNVREVLHTARGRAELLSCEKCASGATVCTGLTRDDVLVANGGHCIRPIKDMFTVAAHTADRYYRGCSARFAGLNPSDIPTVVLATKHWLGTPHNLPLRVQVSGATEFKGGVPNLESHVGLNICIENFDWESYCAILYVLFHECVSHAYQNLTTSPARRAPLDPDDPFGEGWMDWLALRLLQMEITESAKRYPHAAEISRVANLFHNARVGSGQFLNPESWGRPREKTQAWCAQGKQAAEKVETLLKRLSAKPQDDFFSLSFDFNVSSVSTADRKRFVTAINDNLPGPAESDRHHHLKAMRYFRNWIKDRDIDKLISAILSLKPSKQA
jgi:hypothetical protein